MNITQRRSIRLQEYDYSEEGAYFISVCTYNRQCLFGEIERDEVTLNEFGKIAREEWVKTATLRPYVELSSMVIMPNHVHGIIVIHSRDTARRVRIGERFGHPTQDSIPTIIRSYKAAVTKRINVIRGAQYGTVWQSRFYEHVIRDESELVKIGEYIETNPERWADDEEFVARIGNKSGNRLNSQTPKTPPLDTARRVPTSKDDV